MQQLTSYQHHSSSRCSHDDVTYRTRFDETFAVCRVFSHHKVKVIIVLNTAHITITRSNQWTHSLQPVNLSVIIG